MMGAIVTFALFELLIGGRKAALDEQRRVAELRTRLLRDARSIVNDIAIKAVEEIYAYDWLEGDDGMLKGGNLMIANLQGVNLAGANLQGANLVAANLQHANLMLANLKGADLVDANLQGANLRLADLSGAKLGLAKFTEETVLPDNTKWSPEVDTGRFTDSSHPQFWQPSRAKEKSDNKDGGTVQ
ncbi:MAG: hypothetical protein CL610_06160 [Anaerolineaceae bacterium]|nr:hypothetical protein [Anaerolineaceae bacterium]